MNTMLRNSILFTGMAVLLIGYQNCTSGEFGSFTKQSITETSFPYKVEVDYLGFMGCTGVPGSEVSPFDGFFSMKMMSDSEWNGGGIGLSDSFIAEVNNERQKRPSVFNFATETERLLGESSKLRNANIQMDILHTENLSANVARAESNFYLSNIYSGFSLDDRNLASAVSVKSDGSTVKRPEFDFSTRLDLREYTYSTLKNWFGELSRGQGASDAKVLGVHFTPDFMIGPVDGVDRSSANKYARAPKEYANASTSGVYGRHFQLSMWQDQVRSVEEYESEAVGGNHRAVRKDWQCRTLTIVRPDANFRTSGKTPASMKGSTKCIAANQYDSGGNLIEEYIPVNNLDSRNSEERAIMRILGDKWRVNSSLSCVVHESAFNSGVQNNYGCYGSHRDSQTINYGIYNDNGDSATQLLPKYLSVCYATYN